MKVTLGSVGAALLILLGTAFGLQKPFREYPGWEYEAFPLPRDFQEKTEWVFARLMYPPMFSRMRFGGDWAHGVSDWTTDYPRSDRHLTQAVRRLTRIHARSVEQPVNLDDGDDVYNWPFLYAAEVGKWNLTDEQAAKFRDYLLRGGFFMCDDFHGTREWEIFKASMRRVFPDRAIVDIPSEDPIFHMLYDLKDRIQVPGAQFLGSGVPYEWDGFEAKWRGIYDDRGRLMVAICHNVDLGDSWEWADEPAYPEKYSAMGIRIAMNYIVYSMSH
ncbi:MAG TPA: DUF4159 domain-containing protein [Bryobacteraceae bacterium]|nr:DUF4159 domain-containing protein [Bryobacteraceae bacterium]